MTDLPVGPPDPDADDDCGERRRRVALAGHVGDRDEARRGLDDPHPGVRASALGALERLGDLTDADVTAALTDPDPKVRCRATEAAVGHPVVPLTEMLGDPEPLVAEAACFTIGERGGGDSSTLDRLSEVCTDHDDPRCREAAAAALGAIGDRRGLAAILTATTDKPAVRRRAVLALAPFDGPAVDEALARALLDRDWQVRQAAEDLTGEHSPLE